MMLGLLMVAMGEMKMVMGLLMMTGLMSAGGFFVMLGSMLMVFCGFLVVVREPLMIHRTSSYGAQAKDHRGRVLRHINGPKVCLTVER